MQNGQKKTVLSIALDEYEEELFAKAREVVFACDAKDPPEIKRKDFRRLLHLAMWSHLRGVIREAKRNPSPHAWHYWQTPSVAVFTRETVEEFEERMGKKAERRDIIYLTGLDNPSNRWS